MTPSGENFANFDVVIVGAGFAGMYMLNNCRQLGLSTRVFEVGKGVGGTWYWNRYPGSRCDVESVQYSYQFDAELEQEWTWSEKYSTQPEILSYANHVADRFDLRYDIQFETRVISAQYSEADKLWVLETDRNEKASSWYCVFATGFDAMTGALANIEIVGKGGSVLAEKWQDGPQTYLGLTSNGFPNMFMITGPDSPFVLTNMLPSIEQHVNFISECISHMTERNFSISEPDREAEIDWVLHVNEVAGLSLRSTCASWYVAANVPRKPRVFSPYIGGFPEYVERCEQVVGNNYEGFTLV